MENKKQKPVSIKEAKKKIDEWANSHLVFLGSDGKENNKMKKAIINKFIEEETK